MRQMLRRPLTFTLAVLGCGACAHVSREDLDTRLATLRQDVAREIRDGDQQTRAQLGSRIDGLGRRVDGLESELEALRADFDVTIEELEAAVRFDIPVYFAFDDARVRAADHEVLERFSAVAVRYYDGARITVEGFTDPAGPAEYNLRLGARRADAVKDYLTQSGLGGERIRTVSYGESTDRLVVPGAAGPGPAGWQNRRVVIVIDHLGTVPPVVTSQESSDGQRQAGG